MSTVTANDYLDGIPNGNNIVSKSFGNYRTFMGDFHRSLTSMFKLQEKTYMEDPWMKCKDNCEATIESYIKKEIHSTAYILRCLKMSMINAPLDISCSDVSKVTGEWEKDKVLFTINNFNNQKKGRLIMGFGPSASGKTFWANNIISMLSDIDASFPKVFLSIDGGTYREASVIYQSLVAFVISKNIGGISNLVSAGFSIGSSMFSAGSTKKIIASYLKKQTPPNLYVPETLGGCKGGFSKKGFCSSLYSNYKHITKDEDTWVGLCIWQHVEDTACVFGPMYKCIGCKESGKKRERTEGKKYSADAWSNSFNSGIDNAKKAKQWFIIHNTGGRTYEANGTLLPCINLIESNVVISNAIQKKYTCEVYKTMPVKI